MNIVMLIEYLKPLYIGLINVNKEYFKKKYASEVDFCVYDSYN